MLIDNGILEMLLMMCVNFFMIPKIVDWNTGTLEEFKNKFNTWNTHVSKIKNNPSAIPVNIRTKFKYIHGKGSSFGYTFANSYSAYNSSSGTLTEGNIDGIILHIIRLME